MRDANVIIVTITLARNAAEERNLLQALAELKECGIPAIAADGGSREVFVEKLQRMGFEIVRPRKHGLVAQVQAGLRYALRKFPDSYVLYTEPDKYPFFGDALRKIARKALPKPNSGMVIAARNAISFATFPEGQRWAETIANRATDLQLRWKGRTRDYCYGPLLLSKRASEIALTAPDELGWGWRFYAMGRAAAEGLHLETIEMNLPCPNEQRGEDKREDRLYRLKQLRQNLAALEIAFEKRKNPPR